MGRSTFSFDDAEFGGSAAAEETLAELEQTPEAPPSDLPAEDPALADVDLRLETADYYRAILSHNFFDTESPASQVVDTEIRAFIRERLEILLGIRDPRIPDVVSPFDDAEVQALKLLAGKVLKRPTLLQEAAPQVRKMATPAPKTTSKPELVRPRPAVQKISAPAPAPSTKPKAKPAPAAKPKDKPKRPMPASGAEVQVIQKADGQKETLTEGELIEEGGRKYKVVSNELGTLFKKDVTGQVVPPGVSRPMRPEEISAYSERQAEQSLNGIDDTTGAAIVASLRNRG